MQTYVQKYSIAAYKGCTVEHAHTSSYGLHSRQTDLSHTEELNEVIQVCSNHLEHPCTNIIYIQDNYKACEYSLINNDHSYTDDFMFGVHGRESIFKNPVYLITGYEILSDGEPDGDLVTIDTRCISKCIFVTSDPKCASQIIHSLLAHSIVAFVKVERIEQTAALDCINLRLSVSEIIKPENQYLLNYVGNYWAVYKKYYSNPTRNRASFGWNTYYTKQQAKDALAFLNKAWPNSKSLMVYGVQLYSLEAQQLKYKQAQHVLNNTPYIDNSIAHEHALWVVECYQHSESMRRAIAQQQGVDHAK